MWTNNTTESYYILQAHNNYHNQLLIESKLAKFKWSSKAFWQFVNITFTGAKKKV